MGGRTILGNALVVIGLLAMAYQGLTYTTQKKVLTLVPSGNEGKNITQFHFLRYLGRWHW